MDEVRILPKKATENKFNELHNLVTEDFLRRVRSGEASTAAKRKYRKLLSRKRRELGIMGKGGKDVSHKGNRLKLEIPKKNRAR